MKPEQRTQAIELLRAGEKTSTREDAQSFLLKLTREEKLKLYALLQGLEQRRQPASVHQETN